MRLRRWPSPDFPGVGRPKPGGSAPDAARDVSTTASRFDLPTNCTCHKVDPKRGRSDRLRRDAPGGLGPRAGIYRDKGITCGQYLGGRNGARRGERVGERLTHAGEVRPLTRGGSGLPQAACGRPAAPNCVSGRRGSGGRCWTTRAHRADLARKWPFTATLELLHLMHVMSYLGHTSEEFITWRNEMLIAIGRGDLIDP